MLILIEVFQHIYFHVFILGDLPYNFRAFLIKLSPLNFQFVPNILNKLIVPSGFTTKITPL